MLVIVLLCCVTFCMFVHWTLKRHHMMSLTAKVPLFHGALPIIGHAYRLLFADSTHLFQLIKEVSEDADRNGGITTVWLRMKPHFIITDPKDATTILNTCLDKNYVYRFMSPWMGDGLFTGRVSIWKRHRKMLNPAFNPKVLNGFQEIFNKQAKQLVNTLRHKVGTGYFNPTTIVTDNALQTICETAIGIPANGEKVVEDDYVKACHTILRIAMARFMNIWMHFDFLFNFTKSKREQDEAVKIIHKSSLRVIEKRKSEFNNNIYSSREDNRFKPFLELIFELANTKGAFSDMEIREEVDTMITAGHDTTVLVLIYILLMLGSFTHTQDRAYEELKEIFGDKDRPVEKEDLIKMVYLEAVIFETIRLYPIGSIVARDVFEDVQLTNYVIPAGSSCVISFWGIHRGHLWGPDADQFRPDRWFETATLPEHPAAFGGFSLGKRMCIGKNYAIMSLKTTLAHFLRSYRISADHTKLKVKLDILLRPIEGTDITLEAR